MAGFIGARASVVSSGAERKQTYAITTTTTSLTGLAYTPTKVHVFHNGIRLVDGTDYTATDGTSITLNTAAEDGDEVVVISYATFQTSDTVSAANGGTFAGNVDFTGSFTSLGIDDNATSTTITLDSSGRVGIGNTAPTRNLHVTDAGTPNVIIETTATSSEDAKLRIRGSRTTSTSGDLAQILFETNDEDAAGGNLAFITAGKDTPSTNKGVIRFGTTTTDGGTPSEHMRINSNGETIIDQLSITGSSRIIDGYESGTLNLETGTTASSYTTYNATGMHTVYMSTHSVSFANSFTGTPKVFVFQYDGNNNGHASIKRIWADGVTGSGFNIIVGDNIGSSNVLLNWIAIRDKST